MEFGLGKSILYMLISRVARVGRMRDYRKLSNRPQLFTFTTQK